MSDAGTVRLGGDIVVRAAIFDFNGTLTDDEELLYEIFAELLEPLGVHLDRVRYFGSYVGLDDPAIVTRALADAGVPSTPELRGRLLRERVLRYRERTIDDPPLRAGSVALARALEGRVPLAIGSGALRDEITHVLERSGLTELFPIVVAVDDVRHGKPDPETYRTVLERLQARHALSPPLMPTDVVVFEDTRFGVEAARSAGMRVIAVEGSAPRSELATADLVVRDLGVELLHR